jgi:hypothetical protein
MNNRFILSILIGALALAALMTGCATSQPKPMASLLTEAGFKAVPATTPEQKDHLKSLPPGQVSLMKRKGQSYYVYPDAAQNTLYVGRDAQYQAYQALLAKQPPTAGKADLMHPTDEDGPASRYWPGWETFAY